MVQLKLVLDCTQMISRTAGQSLFTRVLEAKNIPIVIGSGPAGTGKTFIASYIGAQKLASGEVQKLILTRPAVSVDEQHGYLPGSIEQKMDPWTRPMFDSLKKYFTKRHIDSFLNNGVIEICPLAYMRGRTFDKSWIIADEMQNSTPNQMKMVLTRIGEDSKLVVTGDVSQCEKGFENINGLEDILLRIGMGVPGISHVQFQENEVVRHEIIKAVIELYQK